MGLCINIFGVPILGDNNCAEEYHRHREEQNSINEAGHSANVATRQDGRNDRTASRNEQQTLSSYFRQGLGDSQGDAVGITGGIADGLGAIAPVVLAAATGGASALGGIGGLLGGTGAVPVDPFASVAALATNPVVLLAGAGLVLYLATEGK